jgi:peptidoglycan/LPS O-acetylase OafA/YrhL
VTDAIAMGTTSADVASRVRSAARYDAADSARVQTLRGLACLLLVGFHVIGSGTTSGMAVPDDSGWRMFANILTPLRMPLFAFLSGFVYAYRPVRAGEESRFARRKLIRLWLPLLTVSTIYYLTTLVAPDARGRMPLSEAWTIYLYGYVHFWFLQSIILIFAATLFLEVLGALSTCGRFTLVLAAAFVLSALAEPTVATFMSWRGAVYLAPFFLLGLGANRFRDAIREPHVQVACTLIFVFAMAVNVYQMTTWSGVVQAGSLLFILIGATGALTLSAYFPRVGMLERLGAYSFAVYLFHPFFVALVRMVFDMLQVTTLGLVFSVCLIVGIVGPTVLELFARKLPLARLALLGRGC